MKFNTLTLTLQHFITAFSGGYGRLHNTLGACSMRYFRRHGADGSDNLHGDLWTRRPLLFSAVVTGYEGISQLPLQMLDLPLVAWRKALDVNLHGVFLANKAVLPLMVRQGEGEDHQHRVGANEARHARPRHGGGLLCNKICARRLHTSSGIGGE